MTTAGTPSLNRPLPDRTEAEARIEMALKVAREGLADSVDSYTYTGAVLAARQSLRDIIRILEKGA
jgi:hypothetical protein